MKIFIALLSFLLLFAVPLHSAIESYDQNQSGYYNLYTLLIGNDLPELFTSAAEVTAARDGESSLLAKENAQDALIDLLENGSGILVSGNDTTVGSVETKILDGEGIDSTTQNDGGNETRTIAIESSSETNIGGLETSTNAEAVARSETVKALVPSNLPEIFKLKTYDLIPIEWAEDGVSATADASALYTSTNGKVRAKEFSGTATKDNVITWAVPEDYVAGTTIKYKLYLLITESTGPSAEGVEFELSGYSSGDGDSINGTFGTAVELTKTAMTQAQYTLAITGWSNAVTITNLAAGEIASLNIVRDHDATPDTYAQPIGVAFIRLLYTAYKAAP